MTEEDTFNILKRTPFLEFFPLYLDFYLKGDKLNLKEYRKAETKFLHEHGWTREAYRHELKKH